jgi:hypothetical protein
LVGERAARELLAEVAIDIMEGMPSRLALGVGEPDEGALPRSMLEREKRPMSPAVFPCESVPGSPEPGTYEEDIESAEEPRVESHDSNEKGVALPPVRADCSQDSDVLMSLFKGLFWIMPYDFVSFMAFRKDAAIWVVSKWMGGADIFGGM